VLPASIHGGEAVGPAAIELGKALFFDPRLSADGTISCNSCHNVMGGGADGRPVSAGVRGQHGQRSAPTVWNAADLSVLFWDGRAATLEEQAKGPLVNPVEMGNADLGAVAARLKRIPGYVAMFRQAFLHGGDAVTGDHAVQAIAAFERTLVTRGSAYDRYVGGDKRALSPEAQRGLALVGSLGCTGCHSGSNFAGPKLPQGTGFYQRFPTYKDNAHVAKYHLADDLGRYTATKRDEDKHMWRVPTWRNVALTAPYFHNGAVATLEEAVRVMAKVQLNKDLKDDETRAIVAFLGGLTGPFPALTLPRLPATPGASVIRVSAGMGAH